MLPMMPNNEFEAQAEALVAKTKRYLITMMGRVFTEANVDEVYRAVSYAFREEIMINWLASFLSYQKRDSRILYYISMEYLPGRILSNNITNLKAHDLIRFLLQRMNRTYYDVIEREQDPGLGNGGLGRLASCFLDSLATKNYPVQAYGLRYQYGIFEQQLLDGGQIEAPDLWLINENPWEFRRDLRKKLVKFCGQMEMGENIHGDEIYKLSGHEEVWALPYDYPIVGYNQDNRYSVVTLRLWSTKESPRNFKLQSYNAGNFDQAAENTALTDVLYPSDHHDVGKRTRLKQEFLLVSASIQDIIRRYLEGHENFRLFADKVRIQINDTHPTLIIAELIRILTKRYDIPWKMAVEITEQCLGYTNHTILKEALEQWDQELMNYLLPRQMRVIERLNQEFCDKVRLKYPGDEGKIHRMSIIENGQVRMANLSIIGSHRVNGVSAMHTEILKNQVFKDFHEMFPEKFVNVTNGVTQRRWLLDANHRLAHLITKRIGDGWITDFEQIRKFADWAGDSDTKQELLLIKMKNKLQLIEHLKRRKEQQDEKRLEERREKSAELPLLDPHSLFDVQVKRIHEYKRQVLNLLHIIMLWQEMSENSEHRRVRRTAIFAGKAAAGYKIAKNIIRLISAVARKINSENGPLKVLFIENYNVSLAENVIPAADLSEQISTAGMEASGTGNMKFTINGALTIGTEDGANIEMREQVGNAWWPFSFGSSSEEVERVRREGTYNPHEVYQMHPKIRKALDTLYNKTFAGNEVEHEEFSALFHSIMDIQYGRVPDYYLILKDLPDYYEAQKKVEELFCNKDQWAEYVIHNIAGMGAFSTDVSIENYCKRVWGLEKSPIIPEILERVQHEYYVHEKFDIY